MTTCINCDKCEGKLYTKLRVEPDLKHRDIMVIGESLTAIAARQGKCMTGPAFKILTDSMLKVGLPIDDEHTFFTTAVGCAVPKKKGGQFPKDPMINCRDRILHQINTIKPRLILVMGKVALQTLTGNMNIKVTQEYGRIQELPYCGDAKVIPIMHPALIMRAPGDYKPFLASLQLAAQEYQGAEHYDPGTPQWQVLDTEELCDKAIEFLKTKTLVGADIETTALDYRVAEFLVLGISFEKNKSFVIPRHMRHRVKEFFALENLTWVWQNGKYDAKVMWRRGLGIVPHQHDTQYQHYVLDETTEHNLGYLTKTFLNVPEYKYKMNQEFKSVTLETYDHYFEALCERVAFDADYTRQLKLVFDGMLDAPGNESLRVVYDQLIMPAAPFLERVEQNGMLVDKAFLDEMNEKYDKLLDKILREVKDAAAPYWDPVQYMEDTGAKTAPDEFNPGSPKQMSWIIFDKMKLKPRIRKARSTDAKVLKSIEEDIPLIKKVLEYRTVQKEKSTYVVGILKCRDVDGRVRSNFNLHVTATGRLSSKEPNVQNIPSANGVGNIRRAFIPPEGKVLVEIDYSGAELRWLAFLSKCPVLMDVFISGRNLHTETATALFGKNFTKQQKMRAKAVNFGIPYGRQAKSFADEFKIPMDEAQKMIDDWLDNYHGARDYLNWCAEQVTLGKYLQTPWGNRRRFGLVTPDTLDALQNEAKNFPIQGSSSHLLLYCAIKLESWLAERDVKIIDLIHDSMLLEVPAKLDVITEVSKHVSQTMVQMPIDLFDCPVPFKTDTDIGTDWANVTAFNHNTGMMEVENESHEVEEVPFDEWYKANNHDAIYSSDWFNELESIESEERELVLC